MPWTYLDVEESDIPVCGCTLVRDGDAPGLDRFEIHAIINADSEAITGNGEISGDLYSK
jgi:hypothetical protein